MCFILEISVYMANNRWLNLPLITSCLLISEGFNPSNTSLLTSCCQLGGSISRSFSNCSSSLWLSPKAMLSNLRKQTDGKFCLRESSGQWKICKSSVYVHMCMNVHRYVCIRIWRPEVGFRCLPWLFFTLFFLTWPCHAWLFTRVLSIWTEVLILVGQTFYQLNCYPAPGGFLQLISTKSLLHTACTCVHSLSHDMATTTLLYTHRLCREHLPL